MSFLSALPSQLTSVTNMAMVDMASLASCVTPFSWTPFTRGGSLSHTGSMRILCLGTWNMNQDTLNLSIYSLTGNMYEHELCGNHFCPLDWGAELVKGKREK